MAPRTGAERYFAKRMRDDDYRAAHAEARRRIDEIDSLIRAIDAQREQQGLSKAELARRAGLPPEAVRRLLSIERPNPTAGTLVALADALDLQIVARPRSKSASKRLSA
jgi:DNA-binding phage protein